MRLKTMIAGLAAAVALAGCAAVSSGNRETTSQETLITTSATVEAVDQTSRVVTLADNADGARFQVVAGPEVRNLAQVEAGDQVEVDFYQATTVSMASPSDSGADIAAVGATRTPEGARPGGLAVATRSLVVTLVSYDSNSGLATFRTPDGFTRRTVVPPDFRSFAAGLQRGARVAVTMTDAVAVSVTETPAA
jgi:hypothetical protein